MRQLDLTNDALKFLKDIDAKRFRQIVNKIFALLGEAQPQDTAQLKGSDYLRVDCGEFRIVYRFDETTVYIILVGKRNDDEVYKDLARKLH